MQARPSRRAVLRLAGGTGATLAAGGWLTACSSDDDPGRSAAPTSAAPTSTPTSDAAAGSTTTTTAPGWEGYGPLQPANADGLMLPAGFVSRVVGVTGQTVGDTGYVWPGNPDGAATFARDGGGWIHVVNHESGPPDGGASRIEFDAAGSIVAAGRVLGGTALNCAGGGTPWGTWLSCEEHPQGRVHECDPTGATDAVVRPALGTFNHEAVAVDPDGERLYLTEDQSDGALYRFTPDAYPDLSSGLLEVMTGPMTGVTWVEVPDPSATTTPTRQQVDAITRFNGGEGICHHNGAMYFTTKGNDCVWRHDIAADTVELVYNARDRSPAELTGVDNITVTPTGDLYVAEDLGTMQIVMLSGGLVQPVVELPGLPESEITGPSFSPDGTRLYFSSQRSPGATYEVTGPWRFA
jgi:secreted PhoX family phosphatase